jgi:DNA-binding GntR family transcriptional regulator
MQDPRGTSVRLSDKAYDLIRHKIITLELPPLAPIDEQSLIEDLQVGRTPIREALQRLAAEDLVFFAPRRGMFVADISITDLQKIFEVRLVLEGFCARLAAQRILPEQLCEMKAITDELQRVPDSDRRGLMHIDERFHDLLYEAADNEFVADTLRRLHALSFRLWHMALDRLGAVRHAMEQHIEITAALEARDEDRTEALIRQHILEFQQELRTVL